MSLKSNKIQRLIIAFFVIGLLASMYLLYELPESIERNSVSISHAAIKEASSALIQTSLVVVATLILGLIYIIISQKSGNRQVTDKVFYVDESQNTDQTVKNTENSKLLDESGIVKEIEESLKRKRTTQAKYDALIQSLCHGVEASQGILYKTKKKGNKRYLEMVSSFAVSLPDSESLMYEFGEGLAGQAAKEKKTMKIKDIPEDYMTITSGLGGAAPHHVLIKPILINDEVEAEVELASFKSFNEIEESIIDKSIKILEKELVESQDTKPVKKKSTQKTESKPKKKKDNNKVQ